MNAETQLRALLKRAQAVRQVLLALPGNHAQDIAQADEVIAQCKRGLAACPTANGPAVLNVISENADGIRLCTLTVPGGWQRAMRGETALRDPKQPVDLAEIFNRENEAAT